MSYFSAIILGIIQGFTEFLPVSSSGHLVIAQELIPGFSSPGILLEVILHLGTLTAVIYIYKDRILKLSNKYYLALFLGSIPAVMVGLILKEQVETLFESLQFVGFALLLTALFNFLTDKKDSGNEKVDGTKGLIIGIIQAFAITPGISRSGATIFAARSLNISKKDAAQFSFLLSVPVILGANILEIITIDNFSQYHLGPMFVGFVAAFLSGLVAIKVTINSLQEKNFKYFAIYAMILGLVIIFFN